MLTSIRLATSLHSQPPTMSSTRMTVTTNCVNACRLRAQIDKATTNKERLRRVWMSGAVR